MLIGYARVSKDEQNLDLQIDALNAAGVEKMFTDKISGAKADRKGLADALAHLRRGDVLVVWKLDRLGRSALQLMMLLNELHERDVEFKSLTEGIDTTTPMGRFYFTMSSALAQLERDRLIERTRASLTAAKARGRTGGRKPKLTSDRDGAGPAGERQAAAGCGEGVRGGAVDAVPGGRCKGRRWREGRCRIDENGWTLGSSCRLSVESQSQRSLPTRYQTLTLNTDRSWGQPAGKVCVAWHG
jgi:DNA invertase Pin-like site-specific DNA recombinase